MLKFFRKYERTFFLIVFLPTIVGLGVTGVVTQIANREGPGMIGRVFGEEIDGVQFHELTSGYRKVVLRGDESDDREEACWRFLALLKYAERMGLRVTREEVGRDINTQMKNFVLQNKAIEELAKRGITRDNPNWERQWQGELFRQLASGPREDMPRAEYERTIRKYYDMSVPEFELYKMREALFNKLLFDVLPAAAAAPPADVWKKFEEEYHKREAELAVVPGKAYRPTAQTIKDDEVKAYYEAHRPIYDEPRRADVEFVAAPFEKTRAEVGTPAEAELRAFYERRKDDLYRAAGTAAVSTATKQHKPFDEVKADVALRVLDEKAKERASALVEKVKRKLDAAVKEKKPLDLKAALEATLKEEKTQALSFATTGLVEEEQVETHPVVASLATLRWFRVSGPERASDVLSGDKASFILRTREIKAASSPAWEAVKDQARKDVVEPPLREIKLHYIEHLDKYKADESWRVDAVLTDYEEIARHRSTEPTPEKLASWFADRQNRWPGKKLDEVKTDVEKAYRLAMALEESKKALDKLGKLAKERIAKGSADPLGAYTDPSLPSFLNFKAMPMLERSKVLEDPILKGAATMIFVQPKGAVSDPFERGDGKGQLVFLVKERQDSRIRDLEEVKAKVRDDILDERGLARARAAAEKLALSLQDLTGDALAKALSERKLESFKTGLLNRDATALPGLSTDASTRVASAVYACEAGAGFQQVVEDLSSGRVFLVRCVRKEPPTEERFVSERERLREDVMKQNRQETKTRIIEDIAFQAKGIAPEHVSYVRDRRASPDGRTTATVRQIFVAPDKATLDEWLDREAGKVMAEVQAALKAGTKFEGAVTKFSEDETSRPIGGLKERVARGELTRDHGEKFEDQLFRTRPEDGVVGPLRSNKGLHLIKVEKVDSSGPRVLVTYRQVLVKADPETRRMPAEIREAAEKKARDKIDGAKKRLDAGEPFALVASEIVTEEDLRAKGEAFEADWTSPFVRAALRQPLEEVTAPVEVKEAQGSTWHLFACTREREDRGRTWEQRPRSGRTVHHMAFASQAEAQAAKAALEAKLREREEARGAPAAWPDVLKEFKKIAKKRSMAPSRNKGGAFGAVALDPYVRPLGEVFLEKVAETKAGGRTDVFRGEAGFHIVEVRPHEVRPEEAFDRDRRIAESLLGGTDWE